MSLDLNAVGAETSPILFDYDWKTVALYNLGVGCPRDELEYVYEKHGPWVVPSFAVVPSYPALEPLVNKAGADMSKVVHGAQSITIHASIPPEAHLSTIARIDGIYDLKRLSQVVFSTRTMWEGQLLFETEWTLVVRDTGGFGGPRPPKSQAPKLPTGDTPLFATEEKIPETQALLYRLSGDLNPLHVDPEFAHRVGFDQGPILHGLCTFGYLTRAVVRGACGRDPKRLKRLAVQFKKPVWPGETLRSVGFDVEQGKVALAAYADGRPDAVIGGAWAEVSPQ